LGDEAFLERTIQAVILLAVREVDLSRENAMIAILVGVTQEAIRFNGGGFRFRVPLRPGNVQSGVFGHGVGLVSRTTFCRRACLLTSSIFGDAVRQNAEIDQA